MQVAQMQKKNLVNLLTRVGTQTCKNGNNLAVFSTSKENASIKQALNLNNTLRKSSNLWNTSNLGFNFTK
jgi:hypothetical protein